VGHSLPALPSGGALCASGLWKSAEGIFEVAQEVEPEDIPERCDPILHPDLLALFVGPPMIGNRYLVDGDPEFGHFRRDFNLEANPVLVIVMLRIISPRKAL